MSHQTHFLQKLGKLKFTGDCQVTYEREFAQDVVSRITTRTTSIKSGKVETLSLTRNELIADLKATHQDGLAHGIGLNTKKGMVISLCHQWLRDSTTRERKTDILTTLSVQQWETQKAIYVSHGCKVEKIVLGDRRHLINLDFIKGPLAVTYYTVAREGCVDQAAFLLSELLTRTQIMAAPCMVYAHIRKLDEAHCACAECGVESAENKACMRCKCVAYCSVKCQRKHWKGGHKAECVTP